MVHADPALKRMLGHDENGLVGRSVTEIVDPESSPSDADALGRLHDCAGNVLDVAPREGFMVRAVVSGSVLMRQDDPLLLVCFQDMTEQLRSGGRAPGSPEPGGLCPTLKHSARLIGGATSRAKTSVRQCVWVCR
ncbi:PAS domain-containing protein [Rhodococcus sp. JS3073]|uniref:PAS domain-containing protein n=1 Tax=Rhodococcus sp. JS3073 TaxID=3002901 RepID=UPI002285EF60|nr:PAS domain-containing protein [Rhodococcus sp. JS3073]WAM19483.1 PAS domain-containing protein [Rhodococcus sp. JS3073]